jgi:hypothetical protein
MIEDRLFLSKAEKKEHSFIIFQYSESLSTATKQRKKVNNNWKKIITDSKIYWGKRLIFKMHE